MTLFLVHTVILLAASWAAGRRLVRTTAERIIAAGLIAWTNLVLTSLLLSAAHHLGTPAWYFRTSLVLALVTWLLLRRVAPEPAPVVADRAKFSPLLLGIFLLTLIPIAYASVRIAGTYVPNNYDSLAYHLPRAMYYLGQDSLAHFQTGNPRQIYFPFNYNLLQAYGLIYSPPLQVLNFINLAAWAAAGLAVYRLCRLSALSANSALVAAWFALTATQILAQATATTNDLPTGAALLCTLVFLLRWRLTRQARDALLAGIGTGLTIGSKLTVIFFAPAAGLLVLAVAWQYWRRGEPRAFLAGVRAWLVPGLLAFALAAPFALINLKEKGEWINQTYNFTLNRPFTFACAAQTSEAYLVQLFLEPLHRFTYDLQFTAQLNAWGQKTFFPHWNESYAFSPLLLFPPDLNEDHVWFGFAGPVIFLCGVWCVARPRRFAQPVVWLGCLGLGWFATYFLLNKWSLYNQRYFVPAILVLSPCLAAAVDAAWAHPSWRRGVRALLVALAASALWMAGICLFQNTSRPYAPLWAGLPAPPALPPLPPLLATRMAAEPRVNIYSTDGNERIFLLMAQGRHQRFTSFSRVQPDAYNVFSEWGFVRKVAYSNIEQTDSYTIVSVPSKRTAGVEFLGTIGRGEPALDYYGLVPHADKVASSPGNRNVMVVIYYGAHDPFRYRHLRIKVAGLNVTDQARLAVGVEYEDGTLASLATFTSFGEAPASVTRPFRRFTIRVANQAGGQEIGAIDIPYVFRDQRPEDEAPDNPASLFADELVAPAPKTTITSTGLTAPEGPYPQWDLPVIRWAKSPVVRLEIPASAQLGRLELAFSLQLHVRESASVDVVLNGVLVKSYQVDRPSEWLNDTLMLTPRPGKNVVEFRNVVVGTEPDWLDYLERYPDVKAAIVSQNIPLEKGAREHWESFGRHETRTLNLKRQTETIAMPEQLYYVFRSLRIEGFRKP